MPLLYKPQMMPPPLPPHQAQQLQQTARPQPVGQQDRENYIRNVVTRSINQLELSKEREETLHQRCKQLETERDELLSRMQVMQRQTPSAEQHEGQVLNDPSPAQPPQQEWTSTTSGAARRRASRTRRQQERDRKVSHKKLSTSGAFHKLMHAACELTAERFEIMRRETPPRFRKKWIGVDLSVHELAVPDVDMRAQKAVVDKASRSRKDRERVIKGCVKVLTYYNHPSRGQARRTPGAIGNPSSMLMCNCK